MEYKTHGVCAREIKFDLDGDTVKSVEFVGGCSGNTQGDSPFALTLFSFLMTSL